MASIRRPGVLIGLVMLLVLAAVPAAASEAQAPDALVGVQVDSTRILTPDEYLRVQAEQYAAAFDVTVEEAERRLNLQPFISELQAKLQTNDSDVYGELRAENGPQFRVVVQVTTGGEERVRQYVAGGPLQDTVQTESVQWTHLQLQAFQEQTNTIRQTLGVDMATTIERQQVIVYVTDAAALSDRLHDAGLQLPPTVVVYEVPELATPAWDLLGGLSLTSCTSGFAGRRTASNTKGVFSAGHCADSQSTGGQLLSPVYHPENANMDINFWGNPPGNQLRNLVWIGNNTWVPVTWLYSRASQYIGQQVCKMGKTTAYTCAVIQGKDYNPGFYDLIQRNPVFIYVKAGGANIIDPGDSGGPFIGATGAQHNAAFGIVSGTFNDAQGQENGFYSAIDYVISAGYEIYTSCANYYC